MVRLTTDEALISAVKGLKGPVAPGVFRFFPTAQGCPNKPAQAIPLPAAPTPESAVPTLPGVRRELSLSVNGKAIKVLPMSTSQKVLIDLMTAIAAA